MSTVVIVPPGQSSVVLTFFPKAVLNAPRDVTPYVQFNTVMDLQRVTFTLRDSTTQALVPGAVAHDPTPNILSFDPTTLLLVGRAYSVLIEGLATATGDAVATLGWSFGCLTRRRRARAWYSGLGAR